MRMTKALFLGAAAVFGATAAATAPPAAALTPECDGRGLVCSSETTEECTGIKFCGYRPPLGLMFCCEEYTTVTNYYYYPIEKN